MSLSISEQIAALGAELKSNQNELTRLAAERGEDLESLLELSIEEIPPAGTVSTRTSADGMVIVTACLPPEIGKQIMERIDAIVEQASSAEYPDA